MCKKVQRALIERGRDGICPEAVIHFSFFHINKLARELCT